MVFLGREISEQRDYSDAVAEKIDNEVRKIIDEGHETARSILAENRDKLELIATRLLEVETLEGDEFAALLEGEVLEREAKKPEASKGRSHADSDDEEEQPWKPPSLDLPPAPSPA